MADMMTRRTGALAAVLATALALGLAAAPAGAQTPLACTERAAGDPPRVMLDCGGGLLIERETAAAMGLSAPGTAGAAIAVDAGAVLAEVPPGRSFQIRTPHAIASVRGTLFAVEVTQESTSVFVLEGTVAVAPTETDGEVTLGPGEGVDVAPDTALMVREWGSARVAALLERFGR